MSTTTDQIDAPQLSSEQVARMLGISIRHVQRLCESGAITFADFGAGQHKIRRFKPEWVREYISKNTTQTKE